VSAKNDLDFMFPLIGVVGMIGFIALLASVKKSREENEKVSLGVRG
jgi:hypothetical protein